MNKISIKKRVFSLILAMVMLMSYIPVTTWAADAGTDIKAIQRPTGWVIVEDYDDYFGDNWLEKLALPETVTITLADDTTAEAAVTWDTTSLDPRTPGYYFLPGQVTLPDGATNEQNLDVSITIQVRQKVNMFANGDFETILRAGNGDYVPAGWYLSGVGSNRYVDGMGRNGSKAAITLTPTATTNSRTSYNTDNEDSASKVAARIAAEGAGQYYFGIYARKGANAAAVTVSTQFLYRYGTQTSTPSNQRPTGNTITLTENYQASKNIIDLPEGVTYAQLQFTKKKTDSTVSFDTIGVYFDDAELIPLKVALKVEPANITEIKTKIPSRFVAINYDKYMGENWKEALGLPKTVEIVTDQGTVGSVGVTWNYSTLDVSKYGMYTLTGTLDAEGFPNPKGLTVTQNIYVRKAENLISNPGFEEGASGWGWGSSFAVNGTPAAEGKYALQVRSSTSSYTSYNMLFVDSNEQKALAARIAAEGAGQYYWGVQVRDYLYKDEIAHTDELRAFIELRYKKDLSASSSSLKGQTQAVTISDQNYVAVGGVFDLTGEEVWFRNDLYLTSSSKFNKQWILADDMQCIPLNVEIPFGMEPADIAEVTGSIPVRAVVENYDKYVGANWKESLGLPATVEVKTSKGLTAEVGIIWDYTPLNLNKAGKYTLVGTLDNSLYPNPNNLYVTQVIYVREYKNLLDNGSFESGATDWGWGSNYKTNLTPAFNGKVALGVKSSANSYASYHIFYSVNTAALATKVTEAGAGQYYLSAQLRDYKESGEVAHTDPLQMYLDIGTKNPVSASTITKGRTNTVTLNNAYQQASSIFNLNGDENWIRINFNITSNTKFHDQWIMIDHVEFVPLNVTVYQHEGAMERVETIIPTRNIIQNYPDYIDGYTTADLLFPETVEVRSTIGEIVKVGVRWDYSKLDLTKKGKYTLVGVLEDMKLDNPNGLTVSQTVNIVDYKNLLTRGGFEDGTSGWNYSNQISTAMNVATPKLEGDYSLEIKIGRMDNYSSNTTKENWLQAFYTGNVATMGQRITQTGAGRYYFGVWIQGAENSTDVAFHTRLLYKNVANGDTTTSTTTSQYHLSAKEFIQSSGIVTVPGDVTWTRLDIYFNGSVNEMRLSTLYMDKAEIVPLNVEAPNMTDIIYMEDPANIYVHEGTSIEGLKLPEKLEVLLKNTQRFDIDVDWDISKFDPNKIGEQTITGSLVLGGKYKNTQGFIPTVKVTVRAKGEELRQTIYISTSGSESNDGLSPESPKLEVKNIATYLRQGYNVKLKRGDVWYLPTGSITLTNIYGTEDAPVVLGAYGSGEALPRISYTLKIENNAWQLVDAKRNVYAVSVSSLGNRNGQHVHRCFVNDAPFNHKSRTNYVTLKAGEFCSYGGQLYVRMAEGEAPKNVEVTPYGSGGNRLIINNVSHLTIEYIHFKGSSAINTMITVSTPTEYLKFQYCSITHCFYYIMVFEASDERVHYKPEISHCYIDSMFSEEEGAKNYDGHWNVGITEGITMRDGVDGAWIHHNHIRNMSHAFIAIESLDRSNESKTRGVFNCYIEDNLLEADTALYARAFNINGGWNLSGIQMCRDNTWRRNRCYGMTTSSHLFGEDNLVYSNVFSYTHCEYDEDGKLFDGKSAQPYGFDVLTYGDHGCVGNILVNNTFYDVSSAVAIYDKGGAVYNSIFANNLIVNWTSDPKAVFGSAGAIYDNTSGLIYVMNNGIYSYAGRTDHFVVDDKSYSAEDVNTQIIGYSDNIFANPKFVNADLSLSGKDVRLDFTLSGESPFRYAGLSINSNVYEGYSAYQRLKAEYTDLYGVPYLAESPSIGAISYCEKIRGEVASVSKLDDIIARTGAEISQLPLPDTVTAVNDQGIDVVLLIDWSETHFDSSKPGTVTLTGQLRNGPHTDLNVTGKTVSIDIHLKETLKLLSIAEQVKGFTTFYNTSLEQVIAQLPNTLKVVTETGFEENLPITWVCNNYNPTVPDTYYFKCVFPDDLISNSDEFDIEVEIRVLHEIGRGMELLINPDFIDGTSAGPWKTGWGEGSFKVTQDPQYLYPGEPASAIVTEKGKYGSLQQDITGQVKLMGDGVYLFRCYMRSYHPGITIDSSYAAVQVVGKTTDNYRCRTKINIGEEWVEYYQLMDVKKTDEATQIMFHTSTGKTADDSGKSFVISGCSFIFLGTTDAEVEATLDSIGLVWNTIRGENEFEKNVMSDLTLPSTTGTGSLVKWSSSDESVISNTGKVTMGRVPKTVVMTATITYNGIETIKKFTVTVPRDPELPTYSASISGPQAVTQGDEFQVVISLKGNKADTFNAYRITLSFSTSKLEFVGISDPNSTVNLDGGKLEIYGIGTERPVTDTFTVTFKAKKSGVTDVKLVKLEMDLDPNVTLDNLPTMTVAKGTVTVDVKKVDADKQDDSTTIASKKDNTVVIWIVIGAAAAIVVAGAVITLIVIKKKKKTPTEE